MEDQSHYVSSTHDAPKPDEQLYLGAEDEMDDVLDLTGGKYTHPAFAVSFPGKHAVEEDEEKPSYSDSLEPSPEDEEPSSISSDIPRFPVIPSAPVEEHDIAALPYGAPSSGSVGRSYLAQFLQAEVVDLLYWRDIKKSGLVFGASLFMLLSLTVFSIVSVSAYIALALLSVSISLRIYKGVLQAIQKSEEGHPFRSYLDSNVAVSEELVNKYSNVALGHVNCTLKELRRLFLVEDLVDSLKFAVLMWVFTYIGALFNGLTLLILALISLFSIPVIYERHQTKVDHYIALISKNFNNVKDLILAKIPGLKRKAE
ncbi:PREDICTED: reticulon-4 isoform X4 [Nanorana parkeri]|uniref:reticulon-4 isoform X4 n=1 Tax=Nanorana parkeri TaxID=125878 RepID=UPI000854464C|nr:PREDICTED: reticulon-4 isoform X4 [Nanorana parkeri]